MKAHIAIMIGTLALFLLGLYYNIKTLKSLQGSKPGMRYAAGQNLSKEMYIGNPGTGSQYGCNNLVFMLGDYLSNPPQTLPGAVLINGKQVATFTANYTDDCPCNGGSMYTAATQTQKIGNIQPGTNVVMVVGDYSSPLQWPSFASQCIDLACFSCMG